MLMDTRLSDPMVGRLLEGRYAVEAFVARGGMAAVYLATDTRLDRRVAVKILRSELSDDPKVVARFEREARAAAQLSHPDVVAVYDQGTDDGCAFLVMEFVPGCNLREVLRDRGRLSTGEAVTVMDHVLAALSAAHAAGLVHRDVKPENVLIAPDGRVKVADFGLARAVAGSTVTTAGSVLFGTAHYFAPERFNDESADARSDVYSAGVLFYELLTGATPFTADNNIALLNRYMNEDIPPPSSRASAIPPQIDALVTWATSRDPSQRPVDAGELHASLVDVRDRLGLHDRVPGLPVTLTAPLLAPPGARPNDLTQTMVANQPPIVAAPAAGPKPRRPRRRRRGLTITLILALAVAAAAVAGWWFATGRYTNAPNVVGLSKSAADAKLKASGLHERWLPSVNSLTTHKGLVAVETGAGRVKHGSTVDLRLSAGPATHPLPPVNGDTVDHATAALKGLDISVSGVTHEYNTQVRKGLVLATDPGENTVVKEGSSVKLIISKGLQHVSIPLVDGKTQEVATSMLSQAGFQVTPIQKFSSTVPSGLVISTSPQEGNTPVKGSTVTIVVSEGPKLYDVPNVEGDTVGAADAAIAAAGFKPAPHEFAPGGTGTVFRESPTGMQQHGTTIVLDWF
jgi:beta-lactam-binding protein with PASTA domain/tRNA A-37 threonylcarbamoyl transferase component Bud32